MSKKKAVTPQMGSSWLVQRLNRPWAKSVQDGVDNPFSFGGGLRNGGLSSEAMGLLRGIFEFDYMGAAEFEFGAVPAALNRLANGAKALVSFRVKVDGGLVFVLCPAAWRQEVVERLRSWAKEEPRLKESVRLHRKLRSEGEYLERLEGWLELDNGFFFFTDMAMWDKVCRLFEVGSSDEEE